MKFSQKDTGLFKTLDIELISTVGDDHAVARMPVDHRNIQPYGFLNGGASLALAETLAGEASSVLCPDCTVSGIAVSCNHIHPVKEGGTVTAYASLIHKGHQTHVWNVEIKDDSCSKTASVITVTNFVSEHRG